MVETQTDLDLLKVYAEEGEEGDYFGGDESEDDDGMEESSEDEE